MTDELGKLFEDLRARSLSEVVAPGAPHVRATIRRRRNVAALTGTGVAVAAVLVGAGIGLHQGPGGDLVAGGPGEVPTSTQPSVLPEPSGRLDEFARAAGGELEDVGNRPASIGATAGVVSRFYEYDMNDMPADTYAFRFYCVGAGKVDVVVKQGRTGNKVLGHGTAVCAAHDPAPLRLTIRQPTDGYLRISPSGDAQSNHRSAFAFEFLSTTGKSAVGPSGPPLSFSPSGGSSPVASEPVPASS